MTPELQRIKIAEACGIEFAKWGKDWMLIITPSATEPIRIKLNGRTLEQGKLDYISTLPNYLNSLDAMHEAEKALLHNNPDLRESYRRTLIEVCGEKPDEFTRYWMAKATQRAEAFLRTLNLWQE